MNYQEFTQTVGEQIRDYLPESLKAAEIRIQEVAKQNGVVLKGIQILGENRQIVPVLYLEGFYEQYQNGTPLPEICEEIRVKYEEAQKELPSPNVADMVQDWDTVKDHIVLSVINAADNRSILENRCYKPLEDLAVIYQVHLGEAAEGGSYTCQVTNAMAHHWGVSVEEIHAKAEENTPRIFEMSMSSLYGALTGEANYLNQEKPDISDSDGLYVLQYKAPGGAGVIAVPGMLEKAGEILQDDFYVLPSSIHEVLLVAKHGPMKGSPRELNQMVRDVNEAEVAKQDQLADHAYEYDRERGRFMSVRESRERQSEWER